MYRPPTSPFAVLLGTLVSLSCNTGTRQAGPVLCEPFDGDVRLEADAVSRLAGEYTLTLVATSGERSGQTARGMMSLSENPPDLRMMTGPGGPMANVRVPFYGMTDVALSDVGALELGGTASSDSTRPGVLVVQSMRGDSLTLVIRLGSEANHRGRTRFDGGYTVLRVQSITELGIRGTWHSGVSTEAAAGYFCATLP